MRSLCEAAASDVLALRAAHRRRMVSARAQTDAVFARLRPEAFFARPIAERHRVIFYLGHVEAFDRNLLCRDCLGQPSRRPDLDRLFAFGIDPLGGHLPADTASDWPHVE